MRRARARSRKRHGSLALLVKNSCPSAIAPNSAAAHRIPCSAVDRGSSRRYVPSVGRTGISSSRLEVVVVSPTDLSDASRAGLFDLFARHYRDVTRQGFEADLANKDVAIILHHAGTPVGFTTLSFSMMALETRVIAVVFSGDTIVDPAFWGEQTLARVWLEQIGRFAASRRDVEVYWFLIVKGHRTYRYLPAFALDYVPQASGADRQELVTTRNAIAAARFGENFDPASGIIRFPSPRGRLAEALADPAPRELANPHVQFFLAANPGFRRGDELACLCALAPENMRPRARRWFAHGFA